MRKSVLRVLSFTPPATGVLLAICKLGLDQGRQNPVFNSYSQVWQTSVPNSGYVYAIMLGTLVWALAQTVCWKRLHGTLKADSLIAQKAPAIPGHLIPFGVGFGFFPIITTNLLVTLAINSGSFTTNGPFYALPNQSLAFGSIFTWSIVVTSIFCVAVISFGKLTSADSQDVYFAGSSSLRTSINDKGLSWKVHFHPTVEEKSAGEDFFTIQLNNLAQELKRLGRLGPNRIELDSTLLAEEKYMAKQDLMIQSVLHPLGFTMASKKRELKALESWLRFKQYSQLKKRYAGQKSIETRKITLTR
ncbi:MAG: hypothetical protein RI567_00060 [Marinobacter sp.]|nr:hypothetical protein [Marinobacter sp.]